MVVRCEDIVKRDQVREFVWVFGGNGLPEQTLYSAVPRHLWSVSVQDCVLQGAAAAED
jgi:hypothetical protein